MTAPERFATRDSEAFADWLSELNPMWGQIGDTQRALLELCWKAASAQSEKATTPCSKCGRTPPFPGGTRCQDLHCPLINWSAPSAARFGHDASAYRLVRADVLAWLHGEAPHPESGAWFERPDGEGAYWWRSRLREATIDASAHGVPYY